MFSFKDFIFNRLFNIRFKADDTNKDLNDKGTLERYMETHGEWLDETIVPEIENYLDNVDSLSAPSKMLQHISDVLGNPPDLFLDETIYRNILQYIVSVYKIKGTEESYQLLFSMMGYNITIVESLEEIANYDEDDFYDEDDLYDTTCPTCSGYTITFTDASVEPGSGDLAPISQETLDKLQQAIEFVEPINAVLDALIGAINPIEEVDVCIDETITMTLTRSSLYDGGILYDDITNPEALYDTNISQQSVASVIDCTGETSPCDEVGVGFDEIEETLFVYSDEGCTGIGIMIVEDTFIVG